MAEKTESQEIGGAYTRSLIEASVDPLVTISPAGKITDVNEASIQATGASREQLVGSRFSEYFTEPEKAEEGYKRVLKEGVVRDYPLTIKHKDGKLMDVLYNASVYKDNKGEVIGVFAAARDITEQKQASHYSRSLIEASLDPLVTISPTGKITDVNEATIQATGASREQLIGSRFSDYFTEPERAEDGYQTVLKVGSVSDYALTIKHRSGKLIDVLYNASTYKDTNGKVIGVFAAARDVTKSRQASQYARSLIEASVDPLVTISPDGKITDVNQATVNVTGVEREGLIGTNFSQYFTEPVKAEKGYQKVLRESSVKDYPLTIRHKDGRLTDVSYNASTYKDARGGIIGVFAAARDVTATKRASQYARSLIEASLDPLVTISPDGKITDVNKATVDVTGVTKRELVGSDFSLYFTSPEKARAGYQEAFKKGEVRDYLLTIRHRSGKETPVLYNASIYNDDKGKVLGVFAAAREIGRAELKAAQARELQRVSKQVVFKVILSHKIGKGTVKISDSDALKIGVEIVDTVTIKPTRKEISKRKISVMSLTASRLPSGIMVMGIADARELGLEEVDTVFIVKAGTEVEAQLDENDFDPVQDAIANPDASEIPAALSPEDPEDDTQTIPGQPTVDSTATLVPGKDKTSDTTLGEDEMPPADTVSDDSAAVAESTDSPADAASDDSAVVAESSETSSDAVRDDTAVVAEAADSPADAASDDSAAVAEAADSPADAASDDSATGSESTDSPVDAVDDSAAVPAGSSDASSDAVSDDNATGPVEAAETSLDVTSDDTAAVMEKTTDATDKSSGPVIDETVDTSQTPDTPKGSDKPAANKKADQSKQSSKKAKKKSGKTSSELDFEAQIDALRNE